MVDSIAEEIAGISAIETKPVNLDLFFYNLRYIENSYSFTAGDRIIFNYRL